MTYFYAGKFCFVNFPTIPIYFFRPRPTLPTVYPYHMACDVNLVISIDRRTREIIVRPEGAEGANHLARNKTKIAALTFGEN